MYNKSRFTQAVEDAIPELVRNFIAKSKLQLRGQAKAAPFEELRAFTSNETGHTIFGAISLTYRYRFLDCLAPDAVDISLTDLEPALKDLFLAGRLAFVDELKQLGGAILNPDFHSRAVRSMLTIKGRPGYGIFVIWGLTAPGVLQATLEAAIMSLALFVAHDEQKARTYNDRAIQEARNQADGRRPRKA